MSSFDAPASWGGRAHDFKSDASTSKPWLERSKETASAASPPADPRAPAAPEAPTSSSSAAASATTAKTATTAAPAGSAIPSSWGAAAKPSSGGDSTAPATKWGAGATAAFGFGAKAATTATTESGGTTAISAASSTSATTSSSSSASFSWTSQPTGFGGGLTAATPAAFPTVNWNWNGGGGGASKPAPGFPPTRPEMAAAAAVAFSNQHAVKAYESRPADPASPSEFTKKILREGSGDAVGVPQPGEVSSTLRLHYTCIDAATGKEIDTSRGKAPKQTDLVGVVPGWKKVVPEMKIGEHAVFSFGYDLCYGEKDNGTIPSKTPLVFEIEVMGDTAASSASTSAAAAVAPSSKPNPFGTIGGVANLTVTEKKGDAKETKPAAFAVFPSAAAFGTARAPVEAEKPAAFGGFAAAGGGIGAWNNKKESTTPAAEKDGEQLPPGAGGWGAATPLEKKQAAATGGAGGLAWGGSSNSAPFGSTKKPEEQGNLFPGFKAQATTSETAPTTATTTAAAPAAFGNWGASAAATEVPAAAAAAASAFSFGASTSTPAQAAATMSFFGAGDNKKTQSAAAAAGSAVPGFSVPLATALAATGSSAAAQSKKPAAMLVVPVLPSFTPDDAERRSASGGTLSVSDFVRGITAVASVIRRADVCASAEFFVAELQAQVQRLEARAAALQQREEKVAARVDKIRKDNAAPQRGWYDGAGAREEANAVMGTAMEEWSASAGKLVMDQLRTLTRELTQLLPLLEEFVQDETEKQNSHNW